jgi:ribonucleotide reductase beta subunit family protein with ferritin-like domain
MRTLEELQALINRRRKNAKTTMGTHPMYLTKDFSDEEFVLYYHEDAQKSRFKLGNACNLCHQPFEDYHDLFIRHGAYFHPQCFVDRINSDINNPNEFNNWHKNYFQYVCELEKKYFDKIIRLVFGIDPPMPPK